MTEVLLDGLGMPESPRWHEGRLWFANWKTGEIVAVGPDGRSEVTARVPTTVPYSIDWLPDGRMLVVSGQEALLLRQEADGTLVPHADLSPFGSVFNEIVVDGAGNAYVNGENIVLVRPDGEVREVGGELAFGNGMALLPGDRTLVVAESYGECLTAFDVAADGGLSGRRVWAATPGDHPDGVCADATGAVWYADVGNAHCVRVREGGAVLETVPAPQPCFACMLGGPDGRTLFVTTADWLGMEGFMDGDTNGHVRTVRVAHPGAGRP